MAKTILKCRYLRKGQTGHSQNLVKYIATRDGVEKLDETWKGKPVSKSQTNLIQDLLKDFPDSKNSHEYQDYLREPTRGNASEFITRTIEDNVDMIGKKENYVQYIAKRPRVERQGAHGLFTDSQVDINLPAVSKEVAMHPGIVWTNVLSIRREDAIRLGFDKGKAWQTLLRSHTKDMAAAMKIPLEDLRWYAAYHDEAHHPHCHIVAYSVGKEPYMSANAILKLKEAFSRDIFKQDRVQIYEVQTELRDEIKVESKVVLEDIIAQINAGTYQNPVIEAKLSELSHRLAEAKGKKLYGYLSEGTRKLVHQIIDELEKEPKISSLYSKWHEQQCRIISFYQDTEPEKVPLSQNEVFRPVRNIVVAEALKVLSRPDVQVLTEEPLSDEPTEITGAEAPAVVDTTPMGLPIPATTDEKEPPPVEEAPKPIPLFGKKRKDTWWNESYMEARKYLYGTKDSLPDFPKALQLMEAEAKAGNGLAMHDLGKMYLSGLGCDKDEETAQQWLSSAMTAFLKMEAKEKNKDYWQYRIGKLHSYGYGTPQDYTQSAAWFGKAVAANNPFAAYALGGQYYRGQGVEQDFQKAFAHFLAAATHESKPNAYAQYQLGAMCKDGIGTEANKVQSEQWYQEAYKGFLAIEQQMADDKLYYRLGSMNMHGVGTPKDLLKAKEYYKKAIALDNVDALYGLGKLYLDESFPEHDAAKAVILLKKAATQDHTYAQYTLGKLLFQGEVTEKNIPEALQWLNKAAEAGNAYAQYFLGKALLYSEDIPHDVARGIQLLEEAAAQGNIYAHYTLGKVFADGEAAPQDIARAISHLEEAAKHGFSPAQYKLAKLLLAENRIEEAVKWLEEAIRDDNQYAQYLLGKMLLFGQNIEKDVERGMALLQASAAQGNEYAQRIINNYGKRPVGLMGARLFASLGRIIQNQIQEDNKKANLIDRKLRQKIEEKKQAHGLRMG